MATPTAPAHARNTGEQTGQDIGQETGQRLFEVCLPGIFACHMEGTDDLEGTLAAGATVLALRTAWARAVSRRYGKGGRSVSLYCPRAVLELLADHAKTVIGLGRAGYTATEIEAADTTLRRIRALIDLSE